MPSGLETVGAISATKALAKDVATIVYRFATHRKAVEDLATRFADDASLLKSLRETLQDQHDTIPALDKVHLRRVFSHLDTVLDRTRESLQKMEDDRIGGKLSWVFFGKEIEQCEVQLYRWTQRLATRLIQLPSGTKAVIKQSVSQVSGKNVAALRTKLEQQTRMETLANQVFPHSNSALLDISDEIILPLDREHVRKQSSIRNRNEKVIVDILRAPPQPNNDTPTVASMQSEVARLSTVLAETEPGSMHIPQVRGYFTTSISDRSLGLVYALPEMFHDLQTLDDLLQTIGPSGKPLDGLHPLEERFNLAREIATAMAYVHSLGWVHRSLRNDNIFISTHSSTSDRRFPLALGSALLVRFEYARSVSASSTGTNPDNWKQEIYRHPERQSTDDEILPEPYYTSKHDVYSLGVVLLEIGRWKSLRSQPDFFDKSPEERQIRLLSLSSRITPVGGSRFRAIVDKCLMATDDRPSIRDVLDELEDISI